MLWLRCLRLFTELVRYNLYGWNCFRAIQANLWHSLGIDIIFTFLSALFQRSRFVWINPFLVVLRLNWFKVCFIFQIEETLNTNDRSCNTKTLNQFFETIIFFKHYSNWKLTSLPTRASLVVETKGLLFLWLAHLNNKSNVCKQILSYRPSSLYQYLGMAARLNGQISRFSSVFFVLQVSREISKQNNIQI